MKKVKAIEPGTITEEQEQEQVERLLNAIDAKKPFAKPGGFNRLILAHVFLLVSGLFLYLVGQVLAVTP